MAYTVTQLAKISGVSIRTLHWYDEVGLLKPAYHTANGYRWYEEEQLLILQQILFFKELGFELKQIQRLLKRNDFDKVVALSSHREVLTKNLKRTKRLIKTIDETIQHLQGTKKMKDSEIYFGFSQEKQAEYEQQLIERFGAEVKPQIAECHQKIKNWTKSDWDKSNQEFAEICKDMTLLIEKHMDANDQDVQSITQRHYEWLKKFWTPTKKSYSEHGRFVVNGYLKPVYEAYHVKLPEFMEKAIKIYAEINLKL